jgi:spore coat-associated protein N
MFKLKNAFLGSALVGTLVVSGSFGTYSWFTSETNAMGEITNGTLEINNGQDMETKIMEGTGFAPSQLKYGEWLTIENTGDMDTNLKATFNQSLSNDVPLDAYKIGYIAYKFSEGEEMTEDILEESRIYLDELLNGPTNEAKSASAQTGPEVKEIAPGVEMIVGLVEEEQAQPAARGISGKESIVLGEGSKEGEKHEFWQLNADQYIDIGFAIKLDHKAGNEYQGVTYSASLNVLAKQKDDSAKY